MNWKEKQHELDGQAFKDSKEAETLAMKLIELCTTGFGRGQGVTEGVLCALQSEHRTNQQSFWRMMKRVIDQYSEFDNDMRNEDAVELCKQMAFHGKRVLPFL